MHAQENTYCLYKKWLENGPENEKWMRCDGMGWDEPGRVRTDDEFIYTVI